MTLSARAKRIANFFKNELGFVNSATLEIAETDNELEIVEEDGIDIGFCHFHHCTKGTKQGQTTIYSLAVLPQFQKKGWGRLLFYRLLASAIEFGNLRILAKCPTNLPSNGFYQKLGFHLKQVKAGKKRELKVWQYEIKLPFLFFCLAGGKSPADRAADRAGWRLGVRSCGKSIPAPEVHMAMVDNHWTNYDPAKHKQAIKDQKPLIATTLDIESPEQIEMILEEAKELAKYCGRVIFVPKCNDAFVYLSKISFPFWWGYSVFSEYGSTSVPVNWFDRDRRPCHLLGGSPKRQALIASRDIEFVASIDGNYAFRSAAKYGKVSTPAGDRIPFPGEVEFGNGFVYSCLERSLRLQKSYWHEQRYKCEQLCLWARPNRVWNPSEI